MDVRTRNDRRAALGEVLLVWALWSALLVAIGVTYTRLAPADTYHVSRGGIVGGLSRVLLEIDFPIAIVAIALVLVAMDALPGRVWWLAGPTIGLCAVAAYPGVVDEGNFDARWVNAVPAVGVALAAFVTLLGVRAAGRRVAARQRLDGVRAVVAGVALVLAIPWIAAELGFFLPHVVFVMDQVKAGGEGVVVHLGHHHGMDSALLIVTAALLSRVRLRSAALTRVLTPFVALLFVYGVVNLAQDFWNEQIVSRGWSDWDIPAALVPGFRPVWAVMLGATVVLTVLLRHGTAGGRPRPVS